LEKFGSAVRILTGVGTGPALPPLGIATRRERIAVLARNPV